MSDLNEILQERANNFLKLGEFIYWKIRKGEFDANEYSDIVEEIKKLDLEIFNLKNESTPVQGSDVCPQCKSKIDNKISKFCSECGINIDEFYNVSTVKCVDCENIISKEDIFCGACGTKQ